MTCTTQTGRFDTAQRSCFGLSFRTERSGVRNPLRFGRPLSCPEITLHSKKARGKVMDAYKEGTKNGVKYREFFKIKVVKEVENGGLSKEAARRKYGIGGKTTVLSWCRKYGREDYPHMSRNNPQSYPQSADEKDRRIAELEARLKQKELAVDALEALIEVANEMYGTDLKKKVGLKRSKS